ncbi:acyl-CoA dehydrogenase family protein [Nocardioides sambongensis]|uniref:acyl-CoA dehydrogenase family protein n=1 Tax=Nocardioides sambongensis TaxID=2589074 RepID=UPI001E4E1C5A|nr:acyl-CoA dehydrogenase family protein [Nocardioides sambongensis]
MRIASLDGSTGWVAGIVGVHPWELAMADERVQEEVWGTDPDTWLASPYAPMGVLTPSSDGDEPGYTLKGRWQFSSGTDHCDWIFLGALLGDAEGKPVQPAVQMHVILPREDYTIVADSWDVVGLNGTGSKDVIVDGAFIPGYRTLAYLDVAEGVAARRAGLSEPGYHVPFSAVFPLGITSAVIGMCEGALRLHSQWQAGRTLISGAQSKDDPYALFALSEAAADIQASRAALLDNITQMYDAVASGHTHSFAERAVGRRTQVQAAWRAVRAMDEVVARSGGNAMRRDNPLQRVWRDAHTGLAHAIHVQGPTFHSAALTDLGLEPPAGPLRSMI